MSFVDMGFHVSQVHGWNGQRMCKVTRNRETIVNMSFPFYSSKGTVGIYFALHACSSSVLPDIKIVAVLR